MSGDKESGITWRKTFENKYTIVIAIRVDDINKEANINQDTSKQECPGQL